MLVVDFVWVWNLVSHTKGRAHFEGEISVPYSVEHKDTSSTVHTGSSLTF